MNYKIFFFFFLSHRISTYLENTFTCVDCFFENGSFIRLLEKDRGKIINIIDVDDNRCLRLIDPIMPNQAQLVLQGKTKKNMQIKLKHKSAKQPQNKMNKVF